MNRILIRFKDIAEDEIYEFYFDERLSLKENLKIASVLIKKDLSKKEVYDNEKNIFLDLDVPVHTFKMSVFPMFYLL